MSLFPWGQIMLCLFPVSTSLLLLMAASLCTPLDCPASFRIPLCPFVSPCTSGWPEQDVRPVSRFLLHLLLPLGIRSEGARLAGGCVCSLCSEAVHTVCPNMYFLITLLLAQVSFSWNRQVFLQCSRVFTALLVLTKRGCIWGHNQVV